MQELFAWLARLDRLSNTIPPEASERMKRLSSPSALDFDQSVVRVVDANQEAYSFGREPARLSVLAWRDEASRQESIEDQALGAQLGAVLTLATNRRVQVASSDVVLTLEGTTQRTFIQSGTILDRSLSGPIKGNAQALLEEVLSSLYGLSDADRAAIGAATELHYSAVLLFDIDPNAAYALCVAGIERLSRDYGSGAPVDWGAWEASGRLDRTFDELGLSEEQIVALRAALLENLHLQLRQTFAAYVVESLPDEFWASEVENFFPQIQIDPDGTSTFLAMSEGPSVPIERFVPRDVEQLKKRLLRSYDARSSYVHEGRGRSAMGSTLSQMVLAKEPKKAQPVEFVGLRAVLRTLILREARQRGNPAPLPNIKAVD